ncbi:TPA: hypothetical protein N0F65_007657 [Lagenidium giganteum]|uniref:Ribosomal protein L27 n=1 Tax=Lagenidium giganteum TaxID=4803 RepID=A0AAV2ZA12_9STRA|nr:TPA: hypothetical protein N0F65_007657 [Lagenidium giganteum]
MRCVPLFIQPTVKIPVHYRYLPKIPLCRGCVVGGRVVCHWSAVVTPRGSRMASIMAMGMSRVFGSAMPAARLATQHSAFMPESSIFALSRRWASKKAGGSTKNGRDSESKRLGVKKFGGEAVRSGNIIIRQRGTKYHPGRGVGMGKDHTIFATRDDYVRFWYNVPKKRQEVSVKDTMHPIRAVAKSSA